MTLDNVFFTYFNYMVQIIDNWLQNIKIEQIIAKTDR